MSDDRTSRRRRPAQASRLVVGGLAAASGIALVGVMAQAAQEPAPTAPEQVTNIVVVETPTPLPVVSDLTTSIDQAVATAPEPPQPPAPTTTTTTTTVASQGS